MCIVGTAAACRASVRVVSTGAHSVPPDRTSTCMTHFEQRDLRYITNDTLNILFQKRRFLFVKYYVTQFSDIKLVVFVI